jgi:hypothetical protein
VDGEPAADDYSNVAIIVPDGHRTVAHAVRVGVAVPECMPGGAERVLPSDDLWALAQFAGDRGMSGLYRPTRVTNGKPVRATGG